VIVPLLGLIALSVSGAALAWWAGGPWATSSEALNPATPLRAAVLAFVSFCIVGSFVILLTGESDGAGPLLAAGALASLGVGGAVARRLLGPDPPMPPPRADGFSVGGLALLGGVGLVAIGYLAGSHGIPLLAADVQGSRQGFAGPVFDLFRWLVPPAALAAFALAVARRTRREARIAAVALVAVAGIDVLLASRVLPFELAIGALLIAFWAGRRPSRRTWAALGAAGLIVFVGVQLVRVRQEGGAGGAGDPVAFAVRRTVDRVLLIHPRTLEIVATTIPAAEPYFGGSTYVRRIAPLLGLEDRPTLGYWLYERLFPGQPGGFAAPGVAGEAWANAGPPLVAAIMAALGALAVWLGRVLARLPGGPVDRAFAALLVVAVARTYATSLNGFLLTLVVATGWWLVASGRLWTLIDPRARAADRRSGP
jgi:hypothetical protein